MAILLSLFSGGVPAVGGPAPDLSIAQSSHDFGNVFVGEEVEHTFLIRNNGVKPIELRQRVAVGQSPPAGGDRDFGARVVPVSFTGGSARAMLARRAAPS